MVFVLFVFFLFSGCAVDRYGRPVGLVVPAPVNMAPGYYAPTVVYPYYGGYGYRGYGYGHGYYGGRGHHDRHH